MIKSVDEAIVEAAARILGDAITGSELDRFFAQIGQVDGSGESTKWRRIRAVFTTRQRNDRCANAFGAFVEAVSAPARWSGRRDQYSQFLEQLNEPLQLAGLRLGDDGKLTVVVAARTLDESAELANRLQALLTRRGVHQTVLACTRRLLIRDRNYFHAVQEASKSVLDRLRELSGSVKDGNQLIDETLERGSRLFPLIALNRYDSPSLRNEQRGIANIARGLVEAFRNPTAHESHLKWVISEEDALDMLSMASLIHRKLDAAIDTRPYQREEIEVPA